MAILTEITYSDKDILISGDCTIQTKIIVKNYNDEGDLTLTEQDSIKDWTLEDERYVPDNGFIGQFVARTLTGNLQNISDDFNIQDKKLELRLGISRFKSTVESWYSLGTFIVDKPIDDEVSDNTKFTAYDLTIMANVSFDADYTTDDFPISFNDMMNTEKGNQGWVTNLWLAQYTCSQCGLILATTDFPHNDFKVLSNQLTSGESCRDVLKYISELAFGYCEISWDDKLYIRTINKDYSLFDKYHIITNDNYYNLETQKKPYGPVNRVFCGLQDVQGQGSEYSNQDSIDTYGETTINIYNNPLTMGTTLETSKQLWTEGVQGSEILWDIKYTPLEMETTGHPWLKAYEPIEVIDMEGNPIITYPFSNNLKYSGHIKSDINSEGETNVESTYGYNDSIIKQVNRIGINVDKANEKITIINQKVNQNADDIEAIKGQIIEIGDTYTKSEIRDIVSGIGVDGVVVTSVETATTIFDINGMTIGRTDSQTKTNVNSNGMIISNAKNNMELLKINNNGVYSENLTARTYLNFGTHGRFEKYKETKDSKEYRIGCFWVEGDDTNE